MIERISMHDLTVLRQLPVVESAPPMLFVHGYFVDGSVFAPLMSHFSARGHPCYAVNLRGRAGSRPGTQLGQASIRDFADDASTIAVALGSPIVVGHSMGGLVTQLVAERGLARAVVLFAPAPPRGISVITPRLALAQLPYLPAVLLSRTVVPGVRDLTALAFNHIPRNQLAEVVAGLLPDSGRAGREMSFAGVAVDRSRVLAPMLVIGGDDDRFIPLSRVARVADRYSAPLRVAPGRGHMLIIEPGWEELAGWVDDWLASIGMGAEAGRRKPASEARSTMTRTRGIGER